MSTVRSSGPFSPADPKLPILRAAAEIYQRRGFEASTMREVAEGVRLSKAGLYHHYPSKDQILRDICLLAAHLLLDQLDDAARHNGTAIERLRMFLNGRLTLIAEEQALLTVVWQERPAMEESQFEEVSGLLRRYRSGLTTLIRGAQSEGGIRQELDPHLLMLAVDGMTGWAYLWYRSAGPHSLDTIAETFWDLLCNGFAAASPT